MKVDELRAMAKKMDRASVEYLLAECYKIAPKNRKISIIDPLAEKGAQGISLVPVKKSAPREKPRQLSFAELEEETLDFTVEASWPLCTNGHDWERWSPAEWRYTAMRCIRQLSKIPTDSGDAPEAAMLLYEIYDVICLGCMYSLFTTETPFQSIQWEQSDLFALVVKKMFSTGYEREKIALLLHTATDANLCWYARSEALMEGLVNELKTAAVKNVALEEAERMVRFLQEAREQQTLHAKVFWGPSGEDKKRSIADEINSLCRVILLLRIRLGEAEEGLRYCMDNMRGVDADLAMNAALELIWYCEENDVLWLQSYDYCISRGARPWDRLVQKRQKALERVQSGAS